jgi:hypothetical protein
MEGYSKEHLPVIWMSNKKAWPTRDILQQWFISSFCPAVQRYCEENGLEPKAMLVLDNAPGHPKNLDSLRSLLPVEVVFLPPNTIEPMDQNVISNFKLHYLVEETDGKNKQSSRDWWKSFDIMKGIRNIVAAWEEVTTNCMDSSWKKLWPEACHDFRGFQENEAAVVNDCLAC